jgi:uracil-DNA glycosylase
MNRRRADPEIGDNLQHCRRLRHSPGTIVLASYHPSAILRADGERPVHLRTTLIEDLTRSRALSASDSEWP